MIAAARVAAFEGLRDIHLQRASLPDVLARVRRDLPDARDAALASDILIGTLRWRGRLDYVIAARSSRPLDRLDPPVLDLLRISAYQLLHLDRVPPSAVVNDAVSIVRENNADFAAGFVNAVLRRLADPATRPALPKRPKNDDRDAWVEYLAVTWSHPEWMVARWVDRLGPEAAEHRVQHDQSQPQLTVRPRSVAEREALVRAFAEAGVATEPGRYVPDALTVLSGNPFRSGVDETTFAVQDEASQLVARFANASPGQRVLDACASPGGKTVLMAAEMSHTGLLVAADLRPARVRLLHDTVTQAVAGNVRVVRHDASRPLPYRPDFDLVVVDAPCSGLGTLRRDPDLKWRRDEDDLRKLARAEKRLLEHASQVVKPGGRLMYATCSSEPEENQDIAAWFLGRHPEFGAAPPIGPWTSPPLSTFVTPDGWLQTLPERDGLDAFFAAAFRRRPD